jgi:uncharacterized protein
MRTIFLSDWEELEMEKNALVTGASDGIGYELAHLLAQDGYRLILVSRNTEKLNTLKANLEKEYGIESMVITKDLSLPGAAKEVFEQLSNTSVDVLVNNAGFGDYGFFHKSDFNKISRMMHLNVLALAELTHLFLPSMLQKKQGKILNVSSVAGFLPGPIMAVYYATKAFVLSFSEAISNELQGTGVTVTVLCPGPTRTGFGEVANFSKDSLFKALPMASAMDVAKEGYKGMEKGRVIVITGFLNRFSPFLVRVLPRKLVRKWIRKIQETRS